MNGFKKVALLLWYGLGIFLALAYVRGPLAQGFRNLTPLSELTWDAAVYLLQALVGLLLLAGLFYFLHQGIRAYAASLRVARPEEVPARKRPLDKLAFPTPPTLGVAVWLLFLAVFFVVGLFLALDPESFLSSDDQDIRYLLITMFAAGIGSIITTILGYLRHASQDQDFDPAFAPWYFARPVMGVLLGAIFYFVLKGGLLATVPGASQAINEFMLAGLGGLVGLFSKNAIEKLREIFNVLFKSEADLTDEVLKKLPDELRERVRDELKQ
jgi:hypothetical protein